MVMAPTAWLGVASFSLLASEAGILAATANNGVGISGVASGLGKALSLRSLPFTGWRYASWP